MLGADERLSVFSRCFPSPASRTLATSSDKMYLHVDSEHLEFYVILCAKLQLRSSSNKTLSSIQNDLFYDAKLININKHQIMLNTKCR